jgi:hypothetical protein
MVKNYILINFSLTNFPDIMMPQTNVWSQKRKRIICSSSNDIICRNFDRVTMLIKMRFSYYMSFEKT